MARVIIKRLRDHYVEILDPWPGKTFGHDCTIPFNNTQSKTKHVLIICVYAFSKVIGLLDVFSPAASLEEFNEV